MDVPHLGVIIIAIILLLCSASFGAVSLGLISDVVKADSRGREMGMTQALMTSGTVIGTVIGGGLYEAFEMIDGFIRQISAILSICFIVIPNDFCLQETVNFFLYQNVYILF